MKWMWTVMGLGLGVVLVVGYGAWWGRAETAPSPSPESSKPPVGEQPALPGALVVIDASRFPTLQAAFDALPERGGLVRLPPGRFPIYNPLLLSRSNVRIEGAGPATCIVNLNQEGKPALMVHPTELEKNPRAWLWRVQLANFRICGDPETQDGATTKPASGDGLLAQKVNELTLHNLWIDHCGGSGVRLVHCEENPAVRHCSFTYNLQTGIQLEGCHDIVVTGNQLEENLDALRCLDGFNLTMTGNNIDDHRRHGVVIENTYGSVVSGNMIEECEGTAILLDRDCYGITLSANVVAHNTGGGIELRDAWGCAVSANTFVLNSVFGVFVGPQSGRLPIAGNAFTDSHIGNKIRRVVKDNQAMGIVLVGTRDVLISGNTFSGLAEHAIHADAQCRRISVVGNLVVDCHRTNQGEGDPLQLGPTENHRQEANWLVPREAWEQENPPSEKPKEGK